MTHSPEPWTVADGDSVMAADGLTIYDIHPNDDYWHKCDGWCSASRLIELANAERIVACVNACRGLSTQYLQTCGDELSLAVQYLETNQ